MNLEWWQILLIILGCLVGLFICYLLLIMISSIFINTKKWYDKDSKYYRWLLNSITGIVLKVAHIKVEVTGKEKIPTDRKFVIVSNHRSNFDPIIGYYTFRKTPIAYLGKESLFRKIPWFGKIIRKCCFRAIDRENPANAFRTIMESAKLVANGAVNIGVYPEGTRNRDGSILPLHDGVFKIAERAKAPLVVMVVNGTEKIAHKKFFQRVTVKMNIIEVIEPEFWNEHDTHEVGKIVYDDFVNNTYMDEKDKEIKK